MANTFLISDTHFGHKNILTFLGADDNPTRKFSCIEEHDEFMVDNWNRVVKPCDKVYHLGDVVMKKQDLSIVMRLNGKKSLIIGNHDIFDAKEYLKVFKNVRGCKVFDNHIFTHIPILRTGRFEANIHGHVHLHSLEDPWWKNVSVEVIGYTPVPYEEIKKEVKKKAMEIT